MKIISMLSIVSINNYCIFVTFLTWNIDKYGKFKKPAQFTNLVHACILFFIKIIDSSEKNYTNRIKWNKWLVQKWIFDVFDQSDNDLWDMEVYEPKWVNSILNIIGVKSLRLRILHITSDI